MAKRGGKKLGDKGKTISGSVANRRMKKKKVSEVKATDGVPPAPTPLSDPLQALVSAPASNGSRAPERGNEKAQNNSERISGYIFMCNAKTKPECFAYRVFGLPAGKKEVLEKIKASMKLFLFDFDLRLLYGVYKADYHGKLNLEPSAFGGKFPAQVRFVIDKDCLPLPESAFRRVLKDNYEAPSRFKQELSRRQVRDLLSLFRPCQPSAAAAVAPMPEAAPPRAILPPAALEDQFQASVRLPHLEDRYYRMHHGRADQTIDPYSMQHRVLMSSQQEFYGTDAAIKHVYPTLEQEGLPAPNDPHYFPENQRMYAADQIVHDIYLRCRAEQEIVHSDRLLSLEREYLRLQREGEFDVHRDNIARRSNYPTPAMPCVPPPMHLHGSAASYHSFSGARQFYR